MKKTKYISDFSGLPYDRLVRQRKYVGNELVYTNLWIGEDEQAFFLIPPPKYRPCKRKTVEYESKAVAPINPDDITM